MIEEAELEQIDEEEDDDASDAGSMFMREGDLAKGRSPTNKGKRDQLFMKKKFNETMFGG